MIKIKNISIKRFRSILGIKLNIDVLKNLITICGENNAGKTNILRAINIFFNPNLYSPKDDTPNHKYYASRGGSVWPEIQIEFFDDKNNEHIKITRSFDIDGTNILSGEKVSLVNGKKSNKTMLEKDINSFLKKIEFFYIESINIFLPQIIDSFIDNIYDIEYGVSRFSGLKKELKESYEKYVEGMQEILSGLAEDIAPLFKKYRENWGVGFALQPNIKKFRDIISDDVEFFINDSSNKKIESKGSGLQRLAYILLHFRIIERMKNKTIILLIDEPDVYLHEGLERKLMEDIIRISDKSQVIITSHSKVFIDTYNLKNVFLIDLKISQQYFERKKENYSILETEVVQLNTDDGAKKIKEYLGIEDEIYDLLDVKNIMVEGDTDKYYIEELCKYFKIKVPKIVKSDGADNIVKWIDFYNSYYSNPVSRYAPKIKIVIDNDDKGRDVYAKVIKKIESGNINNIEISIEFVPNYLGETPDLRKIQNLNTDHQIEDFIYPELFCYLVNLLLKEKRFTPISEKVITDNISKAAHKNRGILHLIENQKNILNPDNGHLICFDSSKSEKVKNGLANFLKIEGDIKIANIIEKNDKIYPKVKEYLKSLVEF